MNSDAKTPRLLPGPREARFTGGSVLAPRGAARWAGAAGPAAPPPGWTVEMRPGPHPQGYRLEIGTGPGGTARVGLVGGSAAGVRHGLATLAQLLKAHGDRLPVGTIEDWPAFDTRGVMLDISRDKVPTMAQLRANVDLLASLKFNHLQLYTEHTFAYVGHEEVWADSSPMTAEEVRELDGYCAARGVELAANQNCFGHLAAWLKRPRYAPLAEIEGDGAWRFMHWERRGAFSLCPTEPGAERFVAELLGQLLPNFTSGLVNIGCDETFDVGWGRSRDEALRRAAAEFGGDEGKARASLFFDFVEKIGGIVKGHGKRPMLWADIAMSYPEMLGRLPKDAVGLAWGYEPDAKFGEECRRLRGAGLEAWVCPGTSSWRSFTGRTTEARGNIAAAAEQGVAEGATGFLVCDWGDVGHMQQSPVSMVRLADAAQAAWGGWGGTGEWASDEAVGMHVFGDAKRGGKLAGWLNSFGDLDLAMRSRIGLRNGTALFNDLFPPVPPPAWRRAIAAHFDEWMGVWERSIELAGSIPSIRDDLVNEEVEHAAECASLCLQHAVSCRGPGGGGIAPAQGDRRRLRKLAERCLREHRRLWVERNRVGGLERSCSHLRGVIAALDG